MTSDKLERKIARRRVLKDGKIVSHLLHGAINVRIRDRSEAGALIELPLATLVPQTFDLLIVSEGKVFPAVIRWRKGDRIGLEFTGPAKPVTLRRW